MIQTLPGWASGGDRHPPIFDPTARIALRQPSHRRSIQAASSARIVCLGLAGQIMVSRGGRVARFVSRRQFVVKPLHLFEDTTASAVPWRMARQPHFGRAAALLQRPAGFRPRFGGNPPVIDKRIVAKFTNTRGSGVSSPAHPRQSEPGEQAARPGSQSSQPGKQVLGKPTAAHSRQAVGAGGLVRTPTWPRLLPCCGRRGTSADRMLRRASATTPRKSLTYCQNGRPRPGCLRTTMAATIGIQR